MGFVREVVSQEDFDKYDLGRYEKRLPMGIYVNSTYWVIDRERDIYLTSYKSAGNDPEPGETRMNYFIFYMAGNMYEITLTLARKKLAERHWSYLWKYESLQFMPYFSTGNERRYKNEELMTIFKEAVTIYRHAGENDLTKLEINFNF